MIPVRKRQSITKLEMEKLEMTREIVTFTADNGGLKSLIGKKVLLFCLNYIYTGELVGVVEGEVLLKDAAIVYETGAFNEKVFKDAQKLGHPLYIARGSIESYSETDKK